MIGVQGLGQPVLKAIANQYFTLGIFNGLAIVGIAIIFDRVKPSLRAPAPAPPRNHSRIEARRLPPQPLPLWHLWGVGRALQTAHEATRIPLA